MQTEKCIAKNRVKIYHSVNAWVTPLLHTHGWENKKLLVPFKLILCIIQITICSHFLKCNYNSDFYAYHFLAFLSSFTSWAVVKTCGLDWVLNWHKLNHTVKHSFEIGFKSLKITFVRFIQSVYPDVLHWIFITKEQAFSNLVLLTF